MSFRIKGLSTDHFTSLWEADEATRQAVGIHRVRATSSPGFPDRITLEDAAVGEELLLLNYTSQTAETPFKATHAIYVGTGDRAQFDAVDRLPPAMLARPQSLRGFDAGGMMLDADLAEGQDIASLIERLFQTPDITEIHAHNARQGCFMARITRA
ncbi:MAG: DUF1203 domain-containing protein [Pseudomonadota bacterium]